MPFTCPRLRANDCIELQRPLRAIALAMLLSITVFSLPGPARAQPVSDTIGDRGHATSAGPARGGGWGGRRQQHAEADAARMLELGRQHVQNGDVDVGRRQLEILIESFPNSTYAEMGRNELARLGTRLGLAPPQAALVQPGVNARASGLPRPVESSAPSEGRPEGFRGRSVEPERPRPIRRPASNEWRLKKLDDEFRATVSDRVFFGDASADIGSAARAVLAEQARWLRRHRDVVVVIDAHADDRGSPDYNNDVAERRGAVVRDRLVAEGIEAERIRIVAHGRSAPIATCVNPDCAAQNRRAVSRILTDAR